MGATTDGPLRTWHGKATLTFSRFKRRRERLIQATLPRLSVRIPVDRDLLVWGIVPQKEQSRPEMLVEGRIVRPGEDPFNRSSDSRDRIRQLRFRSEKGHELGIDARVK